MTFCIVIMALRMTSIIPKWLSVCLSVTHLQLLNRLVDFNGIWYEGNDIQGDFDAIIFNPLASIILKLSRFRFVR
jgi:hypothetical protein